jgi:integrase/recombinase XerD
MLPPGPWFGYLSCLVFPFSVSISPMAYSFDIYDLDKRFAGFDARVRTCMSTKNAAAAIQFKNEMLASGEIGVPRLLKYENCFKNLDPLLFGKPMVDASKEDLERVAALIRARGDWAPQTKADFLKMLHRYYKFLNGGVVPVRIAWLHVVDPQPEPIPYDELPSWDDVLAMADKTRWPRNRAFVTSIWEAGTRIGEHLVLRNRDVQLVEHGANLKVWKSKTQVRTVFVRLCVEDLKAWMFVHPRRDDPDAPFFCEMQMPYSVMQYAYAKKLIGRLKLKAGITKRVTPHRLRHGSASYFAHFLSSTDLDVKYGWKIGSDTKGRYIHVDENSIKSKILHEAGIEDAKQKNIYCGHKNELELFDEFIKERFRVEFKEWMNNRKS